MKQFNSGRRCHRRRSGAAVVEFAVCLPVIILIVLGSIEGASMLFLRQTLVQASYEGGKVAIRSGDQSAMENAINSVADGRRIKNLEITTKPKNISNTNPGDLIIITVSAPGDTNSLIPFGPFKNQRVTAQATMVRE